MNTDGSHRHAIGYPLDEGGHTHPQHAYVARHIHVPDPLAIMAFVLAVIAFLLALRR